MSMVAAGTGFVVFSGVSGKGGGGFWALKDFPALLVELAMLASSERCFRHGDVLLAVSQDRQYVLDFAEVFSTSSQSVSGSCRRRGGLTEP